jgi:hypothetical protein
MFSGEAYNVEPGVTNEFETGMAGHLMALAASPSFLLNPRTGHAVKDI